MPKNIEPVSPTPQMRDFIGKPKPPEPPTDLTKSLPPEPEALSHEELLKRFYEISLRCFNAENQVSIARDLINNYEKITLEQRVVITKLEDSLLQSKEVLKSLSIGVSTPK